MASDKRSYTSANFSLDLDNFKCGILQKVEGGDIEGAVVTLPLSGEYVTKKQLGNLKYNDFKVQCSLAMRKPLQDWIDASLNMAYVRKSGAIHAADFKRDVRYSRHFTDALLTEITFPGGTGDSKEAAYLNLTWTPEKISNAVGNGKVEASPADVKQKVYMPSNFEVTIDGVDKDHCKLISKFDALTCKQKNVRDDVGVLRDSPLEPSSIEYPNISVTFSEEMSQPMWTWHEDFVIKGNNDETKHRNGSVVYKSTNLKDDLLTLNLHTMGIFKGTPDALENNKDAIRRVKFDMYMEQLTVGKWG